jgi:prevent-host-death family protein
MERTINVKELRAQLPKIVRSVQRGEQFTVLYRSRPAFRIVPVNEEDRVKGPLDKEPLYRAEPEGASTDGMTAADQDALLYGEPSP